VTGVAHNAGDDLRAATRAVAYGASIAAPPPATLTSYLP
jgi:hypothetical protein